MSEAWILDDFEAGLAQLDAALFVLAAAHIELDQAVDVREERGRIVIEPKRQKAFTLAELVDGITADNVHATIDTGAPAGREAW